MDALPGCWLGQMGWAEARELQRRLAEMRALGGIPDCVLLLEHPPTFTFGRNVAPAHVPGGRDRLLRLGAECHDADRGGSITFHGPGQLVAYPIVRLAERLPASGGFGDVGAYLRLLEVGMCDVAARAGVAAAPRPPYTGAWVGRRKIGAIGVKIAHGITQHGVALNVTTDLRWFDQVVPCGISQDDGGVTSLQACGSVGWTPERLAPVLHAELAARLGLRPVEWDVRRVLSDMSGSPVSSAAAVGPQAAGRRTPAGQ